MSIVGRIQRPVSGFGRLPALPVDPKRASSGANDAGVLAVTVRAAALTDGFAPHEPGMVRVGNEDLEPV